MYKTDAVICITYVVFKAYSSCDDSKIILYVTHIFYCFFQIYAYGVCKTLYCRIVFDCNKKKKKIPMFIRPEKIIFSHTILIDYIDFSSQIYIT